MDDSKYWFVCNDIFHMLPLIRNHSARYIRKIRLFTCACVRKIWHLLPLEGSKNIVEAAEKYANGEETLKNLQYYEKIAWDISISSPSIATFAAMSTAWACRVKSVCPITSCMPSIRASLTANAEESNMFCANSLIHPKANAGLCELLRDIIFNPFEPIIEVPASTRDIQNLAEAVYYNTLPDGKLDRNILGVLKDSIEERGNYNIQILEAFKQSLNKDVYKGFWPLDLILER